MKILFLAHRLPYPPNKGEKIRAFHELTFLGQRHAVDLFCFADSLEEARDQGALKSVCRCLYVERRTSVSRARGMVRSLLCGEPLSCGFFFSRKFQAQVHRAIEQNTYDVIFVYCSSMTQYIPDPPSIPVVVDFVDIDSAKWAQYAQRAKTPLSWVFSREARELARLEEHWTHASAATIVTTEQEAVLSKGKDTPLLEVIGNGVEIPPARTSAPPYEIRCLQPYALFVGTMDYLPNADAVEYFAKNILPKVRESCPDLNFVIVGRDPSRRVRRLAKLPGVVVTGTVPDVSVYLSGAAVVVAPFRIARGIQNKLLEALAAGKPVVSTSGPARAIGAQHGDNLLVADSPSDFAHALLTVLNDRELYVRLSNGADFVRRNFSWREKLRRLEHVLERAAHVTLELEPALVQNAKTC